MPISPPTTHRRSLVIGSRVLFLLLTGLIYLGGNANAPAATLNLSVKMVHCVTNSLPAWRVGFPNADCDLSYAHNFIDFTLASPTVVYCGDNADNTFAREGFTPLDGNNAFTAIAQDAYGGSDSNSIVVNLPLSTAFQYDLNGNMTNDSVHVLDYDDENQLVTNTVAGSWKSEFVYDGKMRRRIRREYSWQGGTWVKTNEVRYVYAGNLVIQERDSNNSGTMTYTRGLDLSGTMQGAGGIGGLLALTQSTSVNSQPAYYHCDGNGNVTALVNQRQEVVARYLYDPFGNTVSLSGPMSAVNLYRFSSKEVHANSGLSYYLYRYYDGNQQRWLNRDPIQERGGLNVYRFCANVAINQRDPLGLYAATFGEMSQCLCKCGLEKCLLINVFRKDAEAAALDLYPIITNSGGSGDAYRHCYWSCMMARYVGHRCARIAGDLHEEAAGSRQKAEDRRMDDINNMSGRLLALQAGSCDQLCKDAIAGGKLRINMPDPR